MSEPSSLVRARAAVRAFVGYEPGPRWADLINNVAIAIEAADAARAAGWDDAVETLRANYGSHPAADWLEANKHRAAEIIRKSEERTTDE